MGLRVGFGEGQVTALLRLGSGLSVGVRSRIEVGIKGRGRAIRGDVGRFQFGVCARALLFVGSLRGAPPSTLRFRWGQLRGWGRGIGTRMRAG